MGWSQEALGELLKASLGRGSSTSIGKWEQGKRPVPEEVEAFLAQLELEQAFPPDELGRTLEGEHEHPLDSDDSSSRGGTRDTAPPPPPAGADGKASGPVPLLPGGSGY